MPDEFGNLTEEELYGAAGGLAVSPDITMSERDNGTWTNDQPEEEQEEGQPQTQSDYARDTEILARADEAAQAGMEYSPDSILAQEAQQAAERIQTGYQAEQAQAEGNIALGGGKVITPEEYQNIIGQSQERSQARLAEGKANEGQRLLDSIESQGGVAGAIENGQIDKVRQAIDKGLFTVKDAETGQQRLMTRLDLAEVQIQVGDKRLRDKVDSELSPFVRQGDEGKYIDVVAAKRAGIDASLMRIGGYPVSQENFDKINIPVKIPYGVNITSPEGLAAIVGLPSGSIAKLSDYERTIPSHMISGDMTSPQKQSKYYDIAAALADDAISHKELAELGYDAGTIKRAQKFADTGNWQYVPGVGTALLYPVLTPYERIGRIGGDVSNLASLALLAATAPSLLRAIEPPVGQSNLAPSPSIAAGSGFPYKVPAFAEPDIANLFNQPAMVQTVSGLPSDLAGRLVYSIPRVVIASSVAAAVPGTTALASADVSSIIASSVSIANQMLNRGIINQSQYNQIVNQLPKQVENQVLAQSEFYEPTETNVAQQSVQPQVEPRIQNQVQTQVQQEQLQQIQQQQEINQQQINEQQEQVNQQQAITEQQEVTQPAQQVGVSTPTPLPPKEIPPRIIPPRVPVIIPPSFGGSGSSYGGGYGGGYQVSTVLKGSLQDVSSNLPLVKARVTLVSSAGAKKTKLTDSKGRYQFREINPDYYSLSAQKEGFTPIQTRILVNPGENRLDLKARRAVPNYVSSQPTTMASYLPTEPIRQAQRTIPAGQGIVALPQSNGFYLVAYPPYAPNNIVHMKVPPQNAQVVSNIGQAYKSIQSFGGNGTNLLAGISEYDRTHLNKRLIYVDNPRRMRKWLENPSSADVVGIDTPKRKVKKSKPRRAVMIRK